MPRPMKDSGVEWLGDIPAHWKLGRIGQLYTERKEKVSDVDFPPLSVTMKGILPQLSTAAKSDAHDDRKLVRKGDFAINSRSDRRGSCGISSYDGSVSLINIILTPREEMNPVYYDWLFHSTMFADEFYKWGHGIVDDLWTTNWQDMKKIFVPLPPLEEQQRIATFLDGKCARIDSVIEKTRASIEEYKKLKQSLITRAVTKGIRPARPMKDSGVEWIGDIPADWEVIRIKYLCNNEKDSFQDGDWIESPFVTEEGIRYLTTGNVGDGIFKRQGNGHISEDTFVELNCKYAYPNDLVISRLNAPYGRACILPSDEDKYVLAVDVVILRTDHDKRYLCYLMQCQGYQNTVQDAAKGTTMKRISRTNLGNIYLPIAPLEEQKEIARYLDEKTAAIDLVVGKKNQLVTELERLKKSLIFEYVTGKKAVAI